MPGVSKTTYAGKTIIVIDYSNGKEAEMIELLMEAKALIESENKPTLLLNVMNERNFTTPNFVRHAEKINTEISHLIVKQAAVGLSLVQKTILKGFNLFTAKKQLLSFETMEDALKYLAE